MTRMLSPIQSLTSIIKERSYSVSLSPTQRAHTTFKPFRPRPPPPRIPKPHHEIETVESFLKSLKRPSLLALSNKVTQWDQLFAIGGKEDLIKDGTISSPKERRYLLRCLELFRHGLDPKDFAVTERKPKKIRGWGPRVQQGIRLRGKPDGPLSL